MVSTGKKTVLAIKMPHLTLKDLEKGLTKTSVTEKFSVPQNISTYWIKHKEETISKYHSGQFETKRQVNVKWTHLNEMYQLLDT